MKNKLSKYWSEFLEIIRRKEMSILPAHLAYYFIICVIPAFAIIFFVASLFKIPTNAISNFLTSTFSASVSDMIIKNVTATSLGYNNILLFLISFYVTSNGAKSIITASNIVFNIKDSNVLKKTIKSFVITIFLIMLITFILVVPLFGSHILKLLISIGIDTKIVNLINMLYPVLKWPLTLFTIFIIIKVIYTLAPDEKIKSSYVNKGALFTTISWSLITAIYSFYINNIANYGILYGALSNIVILMLWFWLLSYVFVIGLVLNYKNSEEENEKTNTIKLKEIQERIKNSNAKLK